jgi:hypothetical protein
MEQTMARYTARWGPATVLGDEVRRWSARPVRLTAADRPLLWSTHADVPDDSANVVWRIEVVVSAAASTAGALAQRLEALATAMIAAGKQTVTIRDYATGAVVRTYADCRLDAIEPGPPPPGSLANLDDSLVFRFTTAADPA